MKTMRKGLALVLALLLALSAIGALAEAATNATVKINTGTFPDPVFRKYVLKNIDRNHDRKLSASEIREVTTLDIGKSGIKSLKGIEYFTRLQYLYAEHNKLTAVNLAKNTALVDLNLTGNKLKKLDLTRNRQLCYLDAQENQLETLDLTRNTALVTFSIQYNRIGSLKLGTKKELCAFGCYDNKLNRIDIKGCTQLIPLFKQEPAFTGEIMMWMTDDMLHSIAFDNTTKVTAGKKVLYRP